MDPLVLLPGMNCTADLWSGCGLEDSLTPPVSERTLDDEVDRLLAELPPRFVLGGLSLGAIVAMALAVRAPERVAGLVLISTNAKAPTPAQQEGWRAWTARLDAGESPRTLQGDILPLLLSDAARQQDDLRERTLAMGDATSPDTLHAQLALQSTRVDLRERLHGIASPVLVIAGAADLMCPPSFHVEIAAAVPTSRLVTLDGGHLLPMELPDAVGELVRRWRVRCSPVVAA